MEPVDTNEQECLLNSECEFTEENFREILNNEALVEQEQPHKDFMEIDEPNNQVSQRLHSQEGAAHSDDRFNTAGFHRTNVMNQESTFVAQQSTIMLNANYRLSAMNLEWPRSFGNIETLQGISMPTYEKRLSTDRKHQCRNVDEDEENEKKLRRLMKNREYAIRSKERKKAYMEKLENKVRELEHTNYLLKKEKEVNELLDSLPAHKPRYQLRRTSSAPF